MSNLGTCVKSFLPHERNVTCVDFKESSPSDPVPVDGVVLPERPKYSVYPAHGSGFFAYFPNDIAAQHFTLLETKLAEAVAQRDSARKELKRTSIDLREEVSAIRRSWKFEWDRAEKAEAALATERARVLQDLKRVWSVCWTLAGTDSESHMNFTSEENAVGWRDGLASAGARKIVLTEMAILGIQK